jgi:acyl-CoA hydrolase/GNAT superfamily N-acetyltransferase
MLAFLCDLKAPLADHKVYHLLTLGDAPYTRPEFAGRFRHNALFIGPNVRQAVVEGRADYTPVFLSEIPGLIRSGRIRLDVAIVSVSPPDQDGFVTFGPHVDIAPAACEACRLVIAQVNPRMPRVHGPGRLHVSQIDAFCEIERELPELQQSTGKPEIEDIARNIAELIPNGATLQLGIGGIPDGVLRFLRDHQNLGIHTEMFSDGVVDLVERGVINCQAKTLKPGKLITSFVMGSRRVYDFINDNSMVELHPVDFTNDPFIIAQNDNMIAINTCLQIDLTGQVVSDSIGDRFYSGIGGQVDFIRGAARSKGGKPIIALPSTATTGTISRIVPKLDDGAGVVTTRGDVHWVVSEYGAVNLHGLSIRERAMALISIAHPKFRPWLLAEAKQRRMIYRDQIEPPWQTPSYPKRYETTFVDKKGGELRVRPIKSTDESLLHGLLYGMSQDAIYQRFFSMRKTMPHENLQEFCTIDYDHDMALIATASDGDLEKAVGWAMYSQNRVTNYAEAAFLVLDDWQGRGIGSYLMKQLTLIARSRLIDGFTASVLTSNARMLRVFEKCGYQMANTQEGDLMTLSIHFDQPQD